MTAQEVLNELKGSNESNCSITFESNSRGINWKLHIYSNCTKEEFDNCLYQAVYGKDAIKKALDSGEV